MKVNITGTGIGSEPWYESRRIWGGLFVLIGALISFKWSDELGYSLIALGAGFNGWSWVRPKK